MGKRVIRFGCVARVEEKAESELKTATQPFQSSYSSLLMRLGDED